MKSLITALLTFFFLLLSGITSALPTDLNNTALIERQAGCSSVPCSVLVGNGNPHQWIMHKQLSRTVDCGNSEECYVHYEWEKSYTVSADTHGVQFTTGGLAVEESIDTGVFDNLCLGYRGQKVCAVAEIWFTDYTVKGGVYRPCDNSGCETGDDTAIIRAPNSLHAGIVKYLCPYDDDCGEQGDERWIAGPAIPPPRAATLAKRQSCVPAGSCTKVEGDGDPHQWILRKQLSAKKDCGDDYCVVEEADQIDYTINAKTHGLDWISGGFDVQESADTGFHNGCTGGGQQPGKSVCTWAVMWHTDYTVRGGIANSCDTDDCIEYDDTTIIRSPNKVLNGIEYYCAYDDACGDQGQEFWVGGAAGGPPADLKQRDEQECKSDSAITCGTSLVGTGSPKQYILHKQISNPLTCGDGPCYVAPAGETNYWVNWTHDGTDNVAWIAGGFEVTTALQTGILQGAADVNCQGLPHETVCIYADLWHTSYRVRGSTSEGCEAGGCRVLDHNTVITSPNMIKDHVNYVCKHNDECKWTGDAAWIDPHVSGPPPAPKALVEKRCEEEPGPGSLEGNGSPKQKILHKQISNPVLCADGPCYVLPEGETSYTVSFHKEPNDDTVWIDGGFDVAKSVDTGIWEGDGLTGCIAPPHQTVCIFADIWHTQYTVRGFDYVRCSQVGGGQPADHTTVLTSPNKIHNGVTYRCAYDSQCGNSGDESWTNDRAGAGIPPAAAALVKRDDVHLVGDGDPHQWILHHQISDSVVCTGFADGPICVMPSDKQTNTELHAIPTDKPWIDGGFAVTKSLHTGTMGHDELNFCVAEPGHTVCIFADLWYTKYTVGTADPDEFCLGDECKYIITSPNKIKDHVNFICAHDDECHGKWYEEWWDAHVPGGPP